VRRAVRPRSGRGRRAGVGCAMTAVVEDRTVASARPSGTAADVRPRVRRLGLRPPVPLAAGSGVALLLVVWTVGSATGIVDPRVLSAPWTVVATGVDLAVDGRLVENLAVSLGRAAQGLAWGVLAGVALALLSGLSRLGEALLDGPVQVTRAVPNLALLPLLILWFGIGEEMKVITIALGVFIPIYIHTHNGLRSIDKRYVELAETLRLG